MIQNPTNQKTGRTRILMLSAALVMAVLVTLIVTYSVRGDGPLVPPVSTVPLHDTQAVLASDTVTAKAEQTEQTIVKEIESGTRGPLLPKDDSVSVPIPSPLVTSGPGSSMPPTSGIVSGPSLPSGWAAKYRIVNEWYGLVATGSVTVDAGSKADDPDQALWGTPEQGVVVVSVAGNATSSTPSTTEYSAPTRAGRLSVASYNGTCLTLTSTDSTAYQFDVATRQWSCP